MLTARRIEIFKCIVEEFINNAEPVGSKTLMDKYHLPYSSATIRNDMAVLEELGYLEKQHTSSGRIPSTKGYQFYCEHLLEKKVDDEIRNALSTIFETNTMGVDEIIKQSCDIISEMTNLTTGMLGPDASKLTLEHIKLFELDDRTAVCIFVANNGHTESKTFNFSNQTQVKDLENCVEILNDRLKGTTISELYEKLNSIKPILSENLMRHEMLFNAFASAFVKFASDNIYFSNNNVMYQPEFADIEKLKKLTKLLETDEIWTSIRNDTYEVAVRDNFGSKMAWIGDDVAVISNSIKVNRNEEANIMVVGPSRMQYAKIAGLLDYIQEEIEKLFGDE